MILELEGAGAAGNLCLRCSNRFCTFARKPGRRTPLSYTAAGSFQRRAVSYGSPHSARTDHSVRAAPAIRLDAVRFFVLLPRRTSNRPEI